MMYIATILLRINFVCIPRFDVLDYVLLYLFTLDMLLSIEISCEGADYLRGLWPSTPGAAVFSAFMHTFFMITQVKNLHIVHYYNDKYCVHSRAGSTAHSGGNRRICASSPSTLALHAREGLARQISSACLDVSMSSRTNHPALRAERILLYFIKF